MTDSAKVVSGEQSQSCQLLPRTVDGTTAKAKVIPGFVTDTFFLHVTGKKPYVNSEVKLSPVQYVQQPDYWLIEVVQCTPGIALAQIGVVDCTLPLDGVRGKKGIVVMWANKESEQFDIPTSR